MIKYKYLLLIILFSLTSSVALSADIVPKPVKITSNIGHFEIDRHASIVCDDAVRELGDYLGSYLSDAVGVRLKIADTLQPGVCIVLAVDPSAGLPPEGYRINVASYRTTLTGVDRGGLFNAIQTFLQLCPPQIFGRIHCGPFSIPAVEVEDYPRFAYRGAMLDVARTFFDKDEVKLYIDRLSHHKINKFHWHITDDEGWRIEIKSYLELARKGGFRGGDSPIRAVYGKWGERYGGFFTQDDVREVVEYARVRNIEVIPEVELPGHSRAAARIHPEILCKGHVDITAAGYDRRNVWCVSREENYAMLEKIIDELCSLFPSKTIHMGGDEVEIKQWAACPQCSKLANPRSAGFREVLLDRFMDRLEKMLAARGRTMGTWDEAAHSGKLALRNTVYGWHECAKSLAATSQGYPVVVMPSNYFYIDMKQRPEDFGLTWAGMTDTRRIYSFGFEKEGFRAEHMKNVRGIECALWSEAGLSVHGRGRRSESNYFLDYQTYPRLCAVSEVAWCDERARDWDDFYKRLTATHLNRLAAMNIEFRPFDPEVAYRQGVITASAPFTGASVHYTDNGSIPMLDATPYVDAIESSDPQNYLFRTFHLGTAGTAIAPTASRTCVIPASGTQIVDIPMSEAIDRDGLWYLRLLGNKKLSLASLEIAEADSSYFIIGKPQAVNDFHQIRIYAGPKNRMAKLRLKLTNGNAFASPVRIELSPSPYIEPPVTLQTSLRRSPNTYPGYACDYNFSTSFYTSTTPRLKDYFLFTFAAPVECRSITVATGFPFLHRNVMIQGRVEVSYDGEKFHHLASLADGQATVHPTRAVKALKLVSTADGNGEGYVILQDLKILPLER